MPGITINASDGGSFGAYLASPASGSGPGLLVIQEIFGVNQGMRDLCDGYAEQGYIAVCPDLFWRQEPGVELTDQSQEEWDKAFALMNGFVPNFEQGVGDLCAALAHLRGIEGCSGKAGVVGYCLGGSLAYAMACFSDSDASAGYYPVQIEDSLEQAAKITNPLMLHIAEKDGFCPPEAQARIADALGGNRLITINTYAGVDHAFARPGGQNHDQVAADLANSRTADFLSANLA
jgi:carboxymethylenebutenolidase